MAQSEAPAELQRLVESLRREPWLGGTAADLAVHGLDSLLERALVANAEALPAAAALLDALWAQAKTEVGWSEPVWREAFVVASICAAVSLLPGDPELALRRLDEAFIMGGPAELLEPFVKLVEPLVVPVAAEKEQETCADATQPQAAPPFSHSVPRLHNPTSAQFMEYFRHDRPVVLTGCADDWPARRLWADWDWWRRQYGHRHVPLEVGAFDDPGWHEEVSSMGGFVDRMQDGREVVYLAQHTLFDQLPGLRRHFSEPAVVRGRVTRTNAWIGSANTVTPCHFDSYDGLLAQVVGAKHIRLYAPSDTPFLYPTSTPWTAQRRWPTDSTAGPTAESGGVGRGTISRVDVAAPDAARFPMFKKATCVEALLQPGDCLFIPAGWWHWVHAVSRSVSISFVL